MKNEKLTLARDYYFNHQYQEALKEFLYWYQKEEGITKIEAAFFIGKIYSILDYPLEVINTYYNMVLESKNPLYTARVYTEEGFYYRKRGEFKEMARLYEKAIHINPYDIKALTELALYHLTSGNLEKAEELYENILFVNRKTYAFDKKVRNDNIAYIGLAMIMIKKNDLAKAKEYLRQVIELNPKDKETLNKCYANIAFLEEDYNKALIFLKSNTLSKNNKVRIESLEKMGIIYAIKGDFEMAIKTLEVVSTGTNKNHYANYILGYIYYKEQDYLKGYKANMIASREYPKCLIYALKCAMHLDMNLTLKTANLVVENSVLVAKYRPYLIYLSKKYNIFFPGLDYNNLMNKEIQLCKYSLEDLRRDTIDTCELNNNISLDELINYTIPSLIEDMPPYHNEYCDTYIIYYKDIGVNGKDYIIVTTYKDSKDIIDIKLSTKTSLDYYESSHSLRYKPLIRNLFI